MRDLVLGLYHHYSSLPFALCHLYPAQCNTPLSHLPWQHNPFMQWNRKIDWPWESSVIGNMKLKVAYYVYTTYTTLSWWIPCMSHSSPCTLQRAGYILSFSTIPFSTFSQRGSNPTSSTRHKALFISWSIYQSAPKESVVKVVSICLELYLLIFPDVTVLVVQMRAV